MKTRGFTLVEILVVVALIGVLAAVAVSLINYPNIRAKMRDSARVSELRTIQTALEKYFSVNRIYPSSSTWVADLTNGGFINVFDVSDNSLYSGKINPSDFTYATTAERDVYILYTQMQVESSNVGHECSNLNYWGLHTGNPNLALCYGVESPGAFSDN